LATAPAILNAIYDAVGIRITSLPADKRRIKAALQEASPIQQISKGGKK